MATLAVENCLAVLEGKTPPTPVNPEVLERAWPWTSCSSTGSASASARTTRPRWTASHSG